MLLKWAVEGKRTSRLREVFPTPHIDNDSICTAPSSDSITGELPNLPEQSGSDKTPVVSKIPIATDPGKSNIIRPRLISEEHAITLRDEKLLAASNLSLRQPSISMPPTPSSMRIKLPTPALTVENMALLSRELEVNPFDLLTFDTANDDDLESDGSTTRGSTPEEDIVLFEPRRELERNPSSQMTVTAREKRRFW